MYHSRVHALFLFFGETLSAMDLHPPHAAGSLPLLLWRQAPAEETVKDLIPSA